MERNSGNLRIELELFESQEDEVFGRCKIDSFISNVQTAYEKAIGYKAGFFVCETGDGVTAI